MRVLHLDLDAFFASVEQRDKPSLRGKPVIVGGLGRRGVVSTASYEARVFGVRSAMSMSEARSRCPNAAYLSGRYAVYQSVSSVVMAALRAVSPVVEPLSLDEAFVDLAGSADGVPATVSAARSVGARLRSTIVDATGVTASVGVAGSKLMAKIASEQAKPDGLVVVSPGTELELLHPLPVRALPGVGPATAARLTRFGVKTVGDLARITEPDLVDLLGDANGRSLHRLSLAQDTRAVNAERESKSVSVEDTFDRDLTDPALLAAIVARLAEKVAGRLGKAGLSGRTITLKTRLHDFTTLSRSATLPAPTDDVRVITRLATRLLADLDTASGVRLLGVGVSGLSDWVQDDLFVTERAEPADEAAEVVEDVLHERRGWYPGMDVEHAEHGPGWVWGSGRGRVTVRFETASTPPGPVRTFASDDPDLSPAPPPPLVPSDPVAT
jgi:DNA polymerase-4